ncbi:hypothetical protein O1611_g7844 [Lasiodiplodia mahajangana]|uniref:Uncharacterized protein n=1 Tax=Lasiodiplodia mahajangana TaxID=1108764 RepID=A0ACC2JEA2_9PEZI|nr:hypothetical protein O1611_g7844 [Lasiodiplodia mahajangana]
MTYASGEGRECNSVNGELVTRDDVAGEAAAELASGGDRHELPGAEVRGGGGSGSSADSEEGRERGTHGE